MLCNSCAIIFKFFKFYRKFYCKFYCSCDQSLRDERKGGERKWTEEER